ncbi:hypothetical protein [Hyalangium rubrum]|uniref:Uncharacterized protein n=1 Tax=Hyalangium rubrum TaxID=3103134 RepID=A0ABU5H2G9_9BACT|nr:hypothetical protein [Hyalangium sp. s54d21]MDY7227302.1 hypothetical protein [Hyalangium sp. s54d21]
MERLPSANCPRCGAPRTPTPECPHCGVYYAKAEARVAQPALALAPEEPPAPLAPAPAERLTWNEDAEDARRELMIRVFAVPAALLLTWALHNTGMGHSLLRIFLSMWIHELGHAVTAWLTGFTAFPGPWATSIAEVRSPSFSVLLALGFGALVYRGWRINHRPTLIAGIVLLCLQAVGTLFVRSGMARSFISFGGDGGCLVLGTLLMTTLYAGKNSSLHRGWTRWGLLVIGAASFTDAFTTWRNARTDYGSIPFGRIEGVGLSDPTKLVDWFGWSVDSIISRYVNLGWACLAVLGMVYVLGVLRARAALRA